LTYHHENKNEQMYKSNKISYERSVYYRIIVEYHHQKYVDYVQPTEPEGDIMVDNELSARYIPDFVEY